MSLKIKRINREGRGHLEAENNPWLTASKELYGPNSPKYLQRMNEVGSRYFPQKNQVVILTGQHLGLSLREPRSEKPLLLTGFMIYIKEIINLGFCKQLSLW